MFSQCLHRHYLLLGLLTLSHCYCLIDFRFCCCLLFICRVWCLVDFRFLSFRRFIDSCFCFVFLNNRWLDIVNESKPFDFAVSTPALFVAVYRILSCCYCFIDFRFCCYLFFVCRIRRLIDFCFLSFRRFIDCRFCFVFLNNRWLDIVNESKPFDFAVSTPSLFVAWSIDAFSLLPHRFSLLLLLFFVCRVWCLVDFRFLASAALSIAVLLRLS